MDILPLALCFTSSSCIFVSRDSMTENIIARTGPFIMNSGRMKVGRPKPQINLRIIITIKAPNKFEKKRKQMGFVNLKSS